MGDAVRFTQPPSKVLHIRNLPYETTDEELRELAAPFGQLVQTKLNVGTNRNQAFIEFPDQAQSIQMANYFQNSADPAKVRGKTVYLQYSTRNEIVNAGGGGGERPGNCLLVTLENLDPSVVITIDTLHLVFSAFGFVHKIATFEKQAGFQALIQYGDAATAEAVRAALDGRHIPKNLLNDTPHPPQLKISFSQHTDLNVKFQSHRSRDYVNPYLPTAPYAADPAMLGLPIQSQMGPGGNPQEGNVLLASIENMAYPVTVDAINTVFSPYGFVQKIAIFEKNNGWQALVQFPDAGSAGNAKQALEGHAIYDGGFNRLKIAYSVHRDLNVKANNDKSWDYMGATPGGGGPGPMPGPQSAGNGFDVAPSGPQSDGLPPTGQDYERAHEELAKAAISIMGGMGGPPGGGYGPPPGYGPPQGYGPPPGYGHPPQGMGPPPPGYGGRPPPPGYGGPPPPGGPPPGWRPPY